MNKEVFFVELRQLLVELFELDPESIKLETNLYEELDIDSIDAVDLLASLKGKTGLRLSPEKFREVRTINDIVEKVCEHAAS